MLYSGYRSDWSITSRCYWSSVSYLITLLSVLVECTAPAIGIETGDILNSQMTASTGNASLARLNGRFAWCPLIDGYGEYIQV